MPSRMDIAQVGSSQSNNAQGNAHKRVRGPTFMPKIWAKPEEDRINALCNEHGQPVGKETTSSLSHFMGSLARSGKYCPLHKPWNKVSNAKKQILLDTLNDKFEIPSGSSTWILKSFWRKVKNWRARVKKDCYDSSLSFHEQINSKPKRVRAYQWKKLVKSWNKGKSKRISEKNKASRAKKKMVQVTGKKSYAQVREELKEQMEELTCQLLEGAMDEPGPEDIYSKVMGKDNNGTAEMYGLGVRASDIWGVVPSLSARRRDKLQWESTCERLTSELAEYKARDSQRQNDSHTSQGFIVANAPQPLRVGREVYLKSILNSEIVAKGWIRSLDPDEVVGSEQIGPNWCEVNVQVPIKGDEYLVRKYGVMDTIKDAIGATVAWPCPFVSVVPEYDA